MSKFFGVLQGRDGRRSRHGRELQQELVERVAAFEIIQQDTERHAGPAEDRQSAQNLGIFHDDIA